MNPNSFPTKDNLILAKNSLALTCQGYVLMNKKRDILIWELMELIDQAEDTRSGIDVTFREAYLVLQVANIELGINYVQEISTSIPIETGVRIKTQNIMEAEVPLVQHEKTPMSLTYAYYSTEESLGETRARFRKMKELAIKLSMIESSAHHLANNIKKTQKRANALKNITIPMYDTLMKNISNALEEKEHEEFTRLKIIKQNRTKAEQLE